jgi:imidazole glycerol phosphate synthase subunit HisF
VRTKRIAEIWDWAKDTQTTAEIKNKLLLATDSNEITAWQMAAYSGEVDVLQIIWNWAKEDQIQGVKKIFLIATDSEGNTA